MCMYCVYVCNACMCVYVCVREMRKFNKGGLARIFPRKFLTEHKVSRTTFRTQFYITHSISMFLLQDNSTFFQKLNNLNYSALDCSIRG